MAARDILISDVLGGLLCTVTINDGVPAEIIAITNVKTEEVILNEEPEVLVTPTVSIGVERNETRSYKVTITFVMDENETDIITTIRALQAGNGEIILATTEGGDNATGKTLTMTDCDRVDATIIEGHKTRIVLEKKVASGTLAYAVAHNA